MKGRMIHHKNGALNSQLYGMFGECINSVDRKWLNQKLLDVADRNELCSLHFNTPFLSADLENRELDLINEHTTIPVKVKGVDLVVGCDGGI